MVKKLSSFAIVMAFTVWFASQSQADILLSWNTFGNLGTETSEPSVFNDLNVAAASLTLGAGVTAATNSHRFGGSNWFNTGDRTAGSTITQAVTGNDFIQFAVTPNSGFHLTATSLVFSWERSSTGPSSLTLRSSLDGFASDLGAITGLGTSLTTGNTLNISGVSNVAAATTFRLYGFGGTNALGTGGFDTNISTTNVIFNGSVTAVPEPTSIALVSLMCCTGFVAAFRRRIAKSKIA